MCVVEIYGEKIQAEGNEGEEAKAITKEGKNERDKDMLNQFYLLLLVSDPIETTILFFSF